jgi:hypothetical protein
MLHKYTRLLVGVGGAVLLLQPSSAWAQAGANLIGGTATDATGSIWVLDRLSGPVEYGFPGFTFVSMTGTGLNCYLYTGQPPSEIYAGACGSPLPPLPAPVMTPGGSIPITLTVRPTVSGTVTNEVFVTYADLSGGILHTSNNTASDVTIVMAAVPTLPEWAISVLSALLALAGVSLLRRRTT